MPLDSDVALLGTGVAPLIAASHLLAQGKSVLLLNPDWDFFLEDSELPLDPFLRTVPHVKELQANSPESALSILRPDFPGAIEFWSPHSDSTGYHDPTAPHVRQRGRLWISSLDINPLWNWEDLEDLYVEASDAGLNPQILDGITAVRRFPGISNNTGNFRGLFIPKLYDVDITRYRNGLLEFIRERLTTERMICAANQIERMPDGIRFHAKGASHAARLKYGLVVFWTPRLTPWILLQSKKTEIALKMPTGVRLWEQWSLNSREPPDPNTVGMYGDMAVWASFEGLPRQNGTQLGILRAGPKVPIQHLHLPDAGKSWVSSESLDSLFRLCNGFLKWDRFSVHSMKPRAIFEWSQPETQFLNSRSPYIQIVPACDGPLANVVHAARSACEPILKES